MDYLGRWYGICARDYLSIYYHLGKANEITNMILENGKKATNIYAEKEKITLQRGGIVSCHCTQVIVCAWPIRHTPIRMVAQISQRMHSHQGGMLHVACHVAHLLKTNWNIWDLSHTSGVAHCISHVWRVSDTEIHIVWYFSACDLPPQTVLSDFNGVFTFKIIFAKTI